MLDESIAFFSFFSYELQFVLASKILPFKLLFFK